MLRERWIDFRNRLLADARFQRWAARFPPTRPIARRRASRLFDLTAGFVYSQVLAACVELGVFERLAKGPVGPDALDLPEEAALRLLSAAESLGFVERLDGMRFALGTEGAALRGNPGVAEMVRHHRLLYADLADPLAMLRRKGGGRLAAHWAYGDGDADPYSALMAASQPMIARQVLDAYDFNRHRALLDIGGGLGAFARAVGDEVPTLGLSVFDLPDVVARIDDNRITATGGDFRTGAIPRGADVISLIRVLHDHDDGVAAALLGRVYDALPTGGTILIAEPMAGTRSARAVGAYFDIYLWAMGYGRPRTYSEIKTMLSAAGFSKIRESQTALPLITRVITARRPRV